MAHNFMDIYQKASELEEEVLRLSKALCRYGFHLPGCKIWEGHSYTCTCGFDVAWKEPIKQMMKSIQPSGKEVE